jgi:hypothetical protein
MHVDRMWTFGKPQSLTQVQALNVYYTAFGRDLLVAERMRCEFSAQKRCDNHYGLHLRDAYE